MEKETKLFQDYVSQFDKNDKDINWKIDHTYRVAMYSRMLASSLDSQEIDRAYVIGLFHDIGRFEQIDKYHTYDDIKSLDHGYLGYQVLKQLHYDDEIVLNAVRYHNAYKIPDEFSNDPLQLLHCKIIRDADKLDNLNSFYECDLTNQKVNPHLIRFFMIHQMVQNSEVKTPMDEALRELSFVFDINFNESLCLIKNSNMIGKKINKIYEQSRDKQIFVIEELINDYINQRLYVNRKKGDKKYERIG